MVKPFDTSLKELFKVYPTDVAVLLGIDTAETLQFLTTNLTTNIETDLVVGLGDPLRAVIDLNFQVAWDTETLYRVFCYNPLLYREYRVPIHSIVLLLRSRDNDLRLEQGVRYSVFPLRGRMEFVPEVVRIWEVPVERLLTGGLGLLPLAPLAALPPGLTREDALAEILRRIQERLGDETTTEKGRQLLNWTSVLTGLRYTPEEVRTALRSSTMLSDVLKASMTYQGFLEEARLEERQQTLLDLGTPKFGPPDEATKTRLTAIRDRPHLERLTNAMWTVASWAELLATE